MKNLILILIITVIPIISYSQSDFLPGYVLANNGDTLRGYISLNSNYMNSIKCVFKSDLNASTNQYLPGEIAGYRIIGQKYYVTKTVKIKEQEETLFLEYLVDGIVDLFYCKLLDSFYYFIEKDGQLTLLSNEDIQSVDKNNIVSIRKSKRYIGALRYLFSDSPQIQSKIDNTRFDYKSLIKVTKDYHNSVCSDYSCIDYTVSTKNQLILEAEAGVNLTQLRLLKSDDINQVINPLLGINIWINAIKIKHNWKFGTGLVYSRYNFEHVFANNIYYSNYIEYHRIAIKSDVLSVPIMLAYYFEHKKISPFVSIFYNNVFLLGADYSVHLVNRYNQDIIGSGLSTDLRRYQIGGGLSGGVMLNLKNSSYLKLDLSGEFRYPYANFNHFLDFTHFHNYSMRLAYGLPLKK